MMKPRNITLLLLAGTLAGEGRVAAEPGRFIQPPYVYKGEGLRDPFVPLKSSAVDPVFDVSDLVMTGIIESDGTRIALFRRDEGPKAVYRLRYEKLLGNDGLPVEGITGHFLKEEPEACVLQQGDHEVVFRIPGNWPQATGGGE